MIVEDKIEWYHSPWTQLDTAKAFGTDILRVALRSLPLSVPMAISADAWLAFVIVHVCLIGLAVGMTFLGMHTVRESVPLAIGVSKG